MNWYVAYISRDRKVYIDNICDAQGLKFHYAIEVSCWSI